MKHVFMEDMGQYYHQCVKEVKEMKRISVDLRNSVGPLAFLHMNDDKDATVNNYLKVGNEMDGAVQTMLLIKN